jgi:hypothetical protein
LKAYLILKNQNTVIKNDSLFEKGLRTRLSNLLKKKNITLVFNKESETAEQPHLYIRLDIADSLRISDWESILQRNSVMRMLSKNKVYQYKGEIDIIKKVISNVKRNLFDIVLIY